MNSNIFLQIDKKVAGVNICTYVLRYSASANLPINNSPPWKIPLIPWLDSDCYRRVWYNSKIHEWMSNNRHCLRYNCKTQYMFVNRFHYHWFESSMESNMGDIPIHRWSINKYRLQLNLWKIQMKSHIVELNFMHWFAFGIWIFDTFKYVIWYLVFETIWFIVNSNRDHILSIWISNVIVECKFTTSRWSHEENEILRFTICSSTGIIIWSYLINTFGTWECTMKFGCNVFWNRNEMLQHTIGSIKWSLASLSLLAFHWLDMQNIAVKVTILPSTITI